MLPSRKRSTGQSFRLCQPIHTVKERLNKPRNSKVGSQLLHYKVYSYLFSDEVADRGNGVPFRLRNHLPLSRDPEMHSDPLRI
jgi:hypothetical protein